MTKYNSIYHKVALLIKLTSIAFILSSCSFYGGISMHLEKQDAPEFYAPNPIGILGLERKYKKFTGFCEHRSSIPYLEDGLGLNECGVKYRFFN